ncbi:MAG: secretin N-terminal domain-containing protein [Verrucomicrobiota bacterium]
MKIFLLCIFSLLVVSTVQAQPGVNDQQLVDLDFPNADIETILLTYEQYTGKHVIRDAGLAGVKVTVISNPVSKLTKKEAIELIEATLLLNGISIIAMDDKVMKALKDKSPLGEGIPLYTEPKAIPLGDKVINYFMSFSYISVEGAQSILQNTTDFNTNFTRMTAIPDSQAMIFSGKSGIIKKLIEIKELIDVPPAKMKTEFVKLERADAENVTEILLKIFEETRTTTTTRRPTPTPRTTSRTSSSRTNPVSTVQSVTASPTQIGDETKLIPDGRTNRILVITRPVNFEYIKGLIEELDSPSDDITPYERSLNYVLATDVVGILADILAEPESSGSGTTTSNTTTRTTNQTSSSPSSGLSSSTGSGTRSLQAETVPDAPEAIIVGKIKLIADNRANSIMVMGPPESVQRASKILDKLDRRPRQVFLNTVLGTLNVTNNSEFGIDIFQNFLGGDTGAAAASQNTGIGGTDPLSLISPETISAALGSAGGLTVFGSVAGDLSVYVRAFKGTGRFEIAARPAILTANNKIASISSGRREPVPTSTLTNTTNTDSFQTNFEFEDAVLKLDIHPIINADGEVTLRILQTNEQVAERVSVGGVDDIPVFDQQELETTITVPNGSTVILGGLIRESRNDNLTGVPLLSDIPLLGYLFKSTDIEKSKEETIIMIQPTVLDEDSDLLEKTRIEREKTSIQENVSQTPALTRPVAQATEPLPQDDIPIRKALPIQ